MTDQPPTFAYVPLTPDDRRDASHLTTLAICHYVAAGFTLLGGCCGALYVGLGVAMFTGAIPNSRNNQDPTVPGVIIAVFGVILAVLLVAFAVALIYSGRCMQQRKRRVFSIVVAALLCTNFPFGTILGVLTIVVLCRQSVMEAYSANQRP